MKLSEATQEELVYLQLWGEFLTKLTEAKEKNGSPNREEELLRAWYRENNMEEPAKRSPYCLMFYSFIGGIKTVMELSEEEVEP
jgi:hypothetical protein